MLTSDQKKALAELQAALVAATESGLLDHLQSQDYAGPDQINKFCEAVAQVGLESK